MKQFITIAAIALSMFLSGCAVRNTKAYGYFYVSSAENGYVVALDEDSMGPSGKETVTLSYPDTLTHATALCNKLNADLGIHALPSFDPK